jgi:hypothetical protein
VAVAKLSSWPSENKSYKKKQPSVAVAKLSSWPSENKSYKKSENGCLNQLLGQTPRDRLRQRFFCTNLWEKPSFYLPFLTTGNIMVAAARGQHETYDEERDRVPFW